MGIYFKNVSFLSNFLCKLIGGCLIWPSSQNLFVKFFFLLNSLATKLEKAVLEGKLCQHTYIRIA